MIVKVFVWVYIHMEVYSCTGGGSVVVPVFVRGGSRYAKSWVTSCCPPSRSQQGRSLLFWEISIVLNTFFERVENGDQEGRERRASRLRELAV